MAKPYPCHGICYLSVILNQLKYKAGEDVADVDNEDMESMDNRSVLRPSLAFPVSGKALRFFPSSGYNLDLQIILLR